MRVYGFCRIILTFLAFGGLISSIAAPAWADKPIFLQPHDTGKNSSKSNQNASKQPKSTIFLRKDRDKSQTSVRFNKRSTVSSVFRNDLSIYKDLKGLDLMKLTSAGGEPANSDELQKIAAAHRIPTVKAIIALQKQLNFPAPLPVIVQTSTPPVTDLSDWIGGVSTSSGSFANVAPSSTQASVQPNKPKRKTFFNRKKSAKPWKLFGN